VEIKSGENEEKNVRIKKGRKTGYTKEERREVQKKEEGKKKEMESQICRQLPGNSLVHTSSMTF
jgi:hypothetical protein